MIFLIARISLRVFHPGGVVKRPILILDVYFFIFVFVRIRSLLNQFRLDILIALCLKSRLDEAKVALPGIHRDFECSTARIGKLLFTIFTKPCSNSGDPIRALKTLDNTRLMFVIKGASTTEKLCELFAFWGWIHPICKKERPFF